MRSYLIRSYHTHQAILVNAGTLVAATAINSGLGFIYWWLAARFFPPATVGFSSAAISAMILLGNIGLLGLGTMLISELPRQPESAGPLITTALTTAAIASMGLGILFAVAAPIISADLQPLARGVGSVVLFATGVGLTAVGLVLDQAAIGLLRGKLQLGRNTVLATGKLLLLFMAGLWWQEEPGQIIYATWAGGSVLSLVGLAVAGGSRSVRASNYRPQLRLLRSLGGPALKHHLLNLTLQAPGLALPVIVTAMLSAASNASFYVAWMVASFVFVVPIALARVLHAIGAADPSALAQRALVTLGLSLFLGLLASSILLVEARSILSLFGEPYVEQAEWSLRILGLAVFPLIVKRHYVTICRVHNRILEASALMAAGGLLELVFAAIGAGISGLPGLSLGVLIAILIEAVLTAPTVYKAVLPRFSLTSS